MAISVETRRSKIIDRLGGEHYLKVADLSRFFGVSQMSIRRDLRHLEGEGLLKRMHGGLVASLPLRLGLALNPNIAQQIREDWPEKNEIAKAAAALVQSGNHLIFDSGVLSYLTACSLPGDLLDQGELTVITNSLLVALELAPWPGVETILLGGEYQGRCMMNLTGASTLRSLEGLHAEKMFRTMDAMDIPTGGEVQGEETELERKMIEACSHVILLSTRCTDRQIQQIKCLPISEKYTLVTGQCAPAEFVDSLRSQGAQVILVSKGEKQP